MTTIGQARARQVMTGTMGGNRHPGRTPTQTEAQALPQEGAVAKAAQLPGAGRETEAEALAQEGAMGVKVVAEEGEAEARGDATDAQRTDDGGGDGSGSGD